MSPVVFGIQFFNSQTARSNLVAIPQTFSGHQKLILGTSFAFQVVSF